MYLEVFAYLGFGLVFMLIVMGILYGVYRLMDEPALADIGWTAGLGILCLSYFYYTDVIGIRQIILVVVVVIWSARLVFHLFFRVRTGMGDKRYQYLNQIWAENSARNYFVYYMFQGVGAAALSFAFAIGMLNTAPFSSWDIAAIVLVALGILGESWADWSLKQFRDNNTNPMEVCRLGLWRYSRHPNYFFRDYHLDWFFLFRHDSPLWICRTYIAFACRFFYSRSDRNSSDRKAASGFKRGKLPRIPENNQHNHSLVSQVGGKNESCCI